MATSNRLQALNLNLVGSSRPRLSPLGAALLLAALMVLGQVVASAWEIEQEAQRLTLRQQHQQRSQSSAGKSATPASLAASASQPASLARAQLLLPWDTVLHALERAASARVALLSMDAQADARRVRLSAEAKTMGEALAYVETLRSQAGIESVELVSHEEKPVDGVTLVRFALNLVWTAVP
jgi:hypothetical protein